jgi:hypothetical protein
VDHGEEELVKVNYTLLSDLANMSTVDLDAHARHVHAMEEAMTALERLDAQFELACGQFIPRNISIATFLARCSLLDVEVEVKLKPRAFHECPTCSAKPGSPTLCNRCQERREKF